MNKILLHTTLLNLTNETEIIHAKNILNHANYIKFKKRENYSVALAIRIVVTPEKHRGF